MANNDNSRGLVPIRTLNGSPYCGEARPYYVPSTYATALFIGDPVIVTGTANTAAIEDFGAGTLLEINKATAGDGNPVLGSVIGIGLDPDNLVAYKAASTEAIVWVADNPNLIFEIQADDVAAIAATDMASNANLIYTDAGSTTTGLSGAELSTTSMTTTSTFQLKIFGLVDRVDNELGTNAKLEVLINNHIYGNVVAGI